MPSLFFAFVAVLLGTIGSRDQLVVAHFSSASRRGAGILAAAVVSAVLSALAMALAGQVISGLLPAAAKTMLVAMALLFAAVELAWPSRYAAPEEPTRSLAAIVIVLVAKQFGDGARFLVFAIAAATGAPLLAGIGGALGGALALAAAWAAGAALVHRMPLRAVRLTLAAATLALAVFIGLSARGIIA
ncbi:hypothetical protein [Pelagerythrobacter rhizovicinus]|uniref:GDT1 family protein n=1 Tax=Pelagerythrobacter rhizovicinus TaxID=2268576 RepID=A0A4Q2KNW8_9SPHN|nr:hypothetical protein [Pelagerythrobacter rhizovicinus]RXZ65262.1 hypothetical protein ETX26_00405 [Pelagerythrobacter rhizovicinus]